MNEYKPREYSLAASRMIADSFPAMTLPNEVMWSSAYAKKYLGIETGKEYVGPLFTWHPGTPVTGSFGLRKNHLRSFNITTHKPEGVIRHISVKGGGFYDGTSVTEWADHHEHDENVYGLDGVEAAVADWKASLELKKLGVRVVEPLAIIRYKALPKRTYGGATHIVPVEALKAQKDLDAPDLEPCAYVRGGLSDTRVQDVVGDNTVLGNGAIVEKGASVLLRQELPIVLHDLKEGIGLELKPKGYLYWLIDTWGRNLGKMHHAGIVHRFIHPGNLTLAGEMIDNADTQRHTLPDMTKPVLATNMHEIMEAARETQKQLDKISRDIDFQERELGVWPIIFSFAEVFVDTFPEEFRDEIDAWGKEGVNGYVVEELFPDLDDTFLRAYLEEAPELAFMHNGFNFPRQGEIDKMTKKPRVS